MTGEILLRKNIKEKKGGWGLAASGDRKKKT